MKRTTAPAPLGPSNTKQVTATATVSHKVSRPRRDWAAYNDGLVARGGRVLDVMIDTETLANWKVRTGRRGRPAFSAAAITACYTLKAALGLPLRATEGFLRRLFTDLGLDASLTPDFSTLCKRRGEVKLLDPPKVGSVVLIDGTGVSYRGAGSWMCHKYRDGKFPPRRFARVTLTVDAASGSVTAMAVTSDKGPGTGEASQFADLAQANADAGAQTIIGDGAYDTAGCYTAAQAAGVELVCPTKVNAAYGLHPDRDVTLRRIQRLGHAGWKRKSGYHTRSLVEADIGALKACFGDQTRATTLAGARADIVGRANVHNLWRTAASGDHSAS